MSLQLQQQWEYRLIIRAKEALQTRSHPHFIQTSKPLLKDAYAHCDAITKAHSKTFHLASALLPYHKRRATRALYAFCRITDDIVDCTTDTAQSAIQLDQWRDLIAHPYRITSCNIQPHELVALAWTDARTNFHIPSGYADQLINGVSRDLTPTHYQTFDQLAEYAYGVASTVGLMAMHIIGFTGEDALPEAIRLGVALQITNILRDVGEDWRRGRLYLPLDELHAYGLTPEDINTGIIDDRWRSFMQMQIDRNRQLYAESWHGISKLNKDGRFAIATAAALYRDILVNIERHDYNVFTRRARLGTWGKVRRLPTLWRRTRWMLI
jgi:phytoene synthase